MGDLPAPPEVDVPRPPFLQQEFGDVVGQSLRGGRVYRDPGRLVDVSVTEHERIEEYPDLLRGEALRVVGDVLLVAFPERREVFGELLCVDREVLAVVGEPERQSFEAPPDRFGRLRVRRYTR